MAKEEDKGKIPAQRKEDEKGGEANLRHPTSRDQSRERGGHPTRGGAGEDEKPEK